MYDTPAIRWTCNKEKKNSLVYKKNATAQPCAVQQYSRMYDNLLLSFVDRID